MPTVRVTHLCAATTLLEIGPFRLLTDPALDPPGGRYSFLPGMSSTKTAGPAIPPESLGRLDAVLLSHDHHADNLDAAGRAVLPSAGRVLTTRPAARRLGGNAIGLADWESTEVVGAGGSRLRVTATPARHGPPLSLPIAGKVIGFLVDVGGASLYVSGDTVWFSGVATVARRGGVSIALLHMGGVRFPITGGIRYTFDAMGAIRAARALEARTIVPIHFDGWSHFREGRAEAKRAFEAAGLADRVRWPVPGEPLDLDVLG